jgi:hypothetical protein
MDPEKLLRMLTTPRGMLLFIVLGLFADFAFGGGVPLHVSGIVESVVGPHEVVGKHHKRVSVPGQILVHQDNGGASRTVAFSTDYDHRFTISSIHKGDHVTIEGAIVGRGEQYLFSVRVDSSAQPASTASPTASPTPTATPVPTVGP